MKVKSDPTKVIIIAIVLFFSILIGSIILQSESNPLNIIPSCGDKICQEIEYDKNSIFYCNDDCKGVIIERTKTAKTFIDYFFDITQLKKLGILPKSKKGECSDCGGGSCCDGSCCNNTCCDGSCCPPGNTCCNGQCCSGTCCPDGYGGESCCSVFDVCCNGSCCGAADCGKPKVCNYDGGLPPTCDDSPQKDGTNEFPQCNPIDECDAVCGDTCCMPGWECTTIRSCDNQSCEEEEICTPKLGPGENCCQDPGTGFRFPSDGGCPGGSFMCDGSECNSDSDCGCAPGEIVCDDGDCCDPNDCVVETECQQNVFGVLTCIQVGGQKVCGGNRDCESASDCDPCANNPDPCCGNPDPCCGITCGNCQICSGGTCIPDLTDPCCNSPDPCCANPDPCCNDQDPCCGITCGNCESCSAGACIPDPDPCCGNPDPCCGSTDPGCYPDYCELNPTDPICQCEYPLCSGECCSPEDCVIAKYCFEDTCRSGPICKGKPECNDNADCQCEEGEILCADGQCCTEEECSFKKICDISGNCVVSSTQTCEPGCITDNECEPDCPAGEILCGDGECCSRLECSVKLICKDGSCQLSSTSTCEPPCNPNTCGGGSDPEPCPSGTILCDDGVCCAEEQCAIKNICNDGKCIDSETKTCSAGCTNDTECNGGTPPTDKVGTIWYKDCGWNKTGFLYSINKVTKLINTENDMEGIFFDLNYKCDNSNNLKIEINSIEGEKKNVFSETTICDTSNKNYNVGTLNNSGFYEFCFTLNNEPPCCVFKNIQPTSEINIPDNNLITIILLLLIIVSLIKIKPKKK